jgi:hypothetical protein
MILTALKSDLEVLMLHSCSIVPWNPRTKLEENKTAKISRENDNKILDGIEPGRAGIVIFFRQSALNLLGHLQRVCAGAALNEGYEPPYQEREYIQETKTIIYVIHRGKNTSPHQGGRGGGAAVPRWVMRRSKINEGRSRVLEGAATSYT